MATTPRPITDGKKPAVSTADTGLQAYTKGVQAELKKITWPTWAQIWSQTVVVLIMTTLMTAVLWVIDTIFRYIISVITPSHPF